MKKIVINIKQPTTLSYPIFVGEGILGLITELCSLKKYSKVVVLTDKVIHKVLLKNMPNFLPENASMIVLPFGERAKNIECIQEVWKELLAVGCDRKSILINIGGGVITDMGGFAASTYMRGIDFINVPTTLLSQVDASVGGKTGVNFEDIKNLVGTFNQPSAVIIDTNTLKTLPSREFISGFGEIIKHGLIEDRRYFDFVTSKKPQEFTSEEIETIIETSCTIKAKFVEEDEKEGLARRVINFGHTIGHAIESLSLGTDNPLLHGEAVGLGMIAESFISLKMNLLKQEDFVLIFKAIEQAGLPIKYKGLQEQEILTKVKGDKKTEHGVVNFTLIEGIGKGIVNQQVEEALLKKAIEQINEI